MKKARATVSKVAEYAPDPVFHNGPPDTAPAEDLESFLRKYEPIGAAREADALRHAARGPGPRSGH